MLPSNQQQIIEQAKFTHTPLGKAFEKQTRTIEDQGKNQVDTLKILKPKEERKLIEDKPNNQQRVSIIFNDLINERKGLMSELYNSVDYNNLNFKYVDPKNNYISFCEYRDSKRHFNAIKNGEIRFDKAIKKKKKKDGFLNKLSNISISKKTAKKRGD